MNIFGLEISSAQEAKRIREAVEDLERKLEDLGWIKINGSDSDSHTQAQESFKNMVKRSRLAFIKNPIIGHAVNLTTWYTFGLGVTLPKAQDKEVQKIVTDFWNDPDNRLSFTAPLNQHKLSNKQQYDGELAIVLQVDLDGAVYVRFIDPLTIENIITDPIDTMRPLFYKRRINGEDQYIPDYENGIALLRDDSRYAEKWQAMLKALDIKDKQVVSNTFIYHVKTNNDILDKRGIPDVYRALDWMNSNTKLNSDTATFINAQAQYAWKKKITGTKNQVNEFQARMQQNTRLTNPSAQAGSTYLHNAGVEMEAVGLPSSTGSLFETGIRRSLLMLCAAFGIMEHYFGDPSTGNLATSKSMELPMLKKFLARQEFWTGVYDDVLQFQLNMKLMAVNKKAFLYNEMKNRIKPVPSRDYKDRLIDIDFPPILDEDIKMMAEALSMAKEKRLVPVETAQRRFMQSAGVDNIEEELKKEFEEPAAEPDLFGGAFPPDKKVKESVSIPRSIKSERAETARLADKNKEVIRKMNAYLKDIAGSYQSLYESMKADLSFARTSSGKLSVYVNKLRGHLKEFQKAMVAHAGTYYPQAVSIAESYVKSRLGIKESRAVRLLETRLDEFLDRQISWNSEFVKSSLLPALLEKFEEFVRKSYDSEDEGQREFDEIVKSMENRVGKYASSFWTVEERAVKEAAKGSANKANFIGVQDEANCEGCAEAIDGNPWNVDEVPTPGEQDCLTNCRHAIQLVGDDDLTESDIQILKDAEDEARKGFKLLKETAYA